MPWSALPERLNSPEKWAGTDWDNGWQRWLLKYKGWFAFGPRAAQRWARWREWPILIAAFRGRGQWRWEDDASIWTSGKSGALLRGLLWRSDDEFYLSRCQKAAAWSVQLQWPLFFAAHVMVNDRPLFFYIGAHRDADKVYWTPSVFLGRTWK